MNRSQFVSLILSFALLGPLFSWSPSSAEEVEDQEQDVALYLYTYNGIGRLHTMETGGHGDADQVTIQPGSSAYFALNISLQADLPVKSYRTDVGFHLYLYANSGSALDNGHLNLLVRDGTTMTGGELLASGDMNIPTLFASNNEAHVDIYWEDDAGPTYTFDANNYIVLELENDGDNTVTINLDTGKSGDSPSRLITSTNPVRDITVYTQSYNLATPDPEDLVDTEHFKPNLPSDISKMFVSGTALNAFGTYDITAFKVEIFDSDDSELFVGETEIDEPDDETGTNQFEEIVWNYNDPAEPSQKHKGKGIYTVLVSAINQQGNEFSLETSIQMDAYGVYLHTPEPDQNVAVGGDVEYQIFVMNAGDETDQFTITPSETSDNWAVSPETWTSSSLSPGDEQAITFTVSASDSTDMVGKSTTIQFRGESGEAVIDEIFDLDATVTVGAEYEIALYFEDATSGQAVSNLNSVGVAGEWNQYMLSVSNQGQATDGVQLLAQDVPPDWEVKFEYGSLNAGSITVENIPRPGDGDNIANVTVWVKPAQGGTIETADIELIGISQGNTSKSDSSTLSVTRTFGLVLSATPTSGIFDRKVAGETFDIDLLLESAVEDERTIRLYIPDEDEEGGLPSGWSYSFKENGATVTETNLAGGESKVLVLLITVGSQAVYSDTGYSFDAMAQDLSDSTVLARQEITVVLNLESGFSLSSVRYKETLKPGDSHTFYLNIDNIANGKDIFTLSAQHPSGWRVLFPDGNIVEIEAGRSQSVPIQITVSDEAKDGDQESVVILVDSQLANEEQKKSFVVDVEQGFTSRLSSALTDLWYIFVFLGLIIIVGIATQYRQDDDWDEDYSDDEPAPAKTDESSEDWDDWK